MNLREITCAYCGRRGRASAEHVMAKWCHRASVNSVGVTPARRVHKWGGAPTIRDVCGPCNNTQLSQLDEAARRIVQQADSAPPRLNPDDARVLARWAGKVAFNIQRLCFQEGTQGQEPRIPTSAVKWILDATESDQIRVAASWIMANDPIRENYGAFGPNGTPLPRRYVQAGPIVLFVAWEHPQQPASTAMIHEADCSRVPAIGISHPDLNSLQLPVMANTSMLLKGLAAMPEIATELLKRLE